MAKQKESYASVDAFVNDYVNESEILYTPENVRLMECIFVASVEGEATEDESDCRRGDADEATADRRPLTRRPCPRRRPRVATYRVPDRLCQGEGDCRGDCGRRGLRGDHEGLYGGRLHRRADAARLPGGRNSTTYGEAFMAGAMALEHVGDVSDVIVTDYGYFILRYAKDLESGEADFETRKEPRPRNPDQQEERRIFAFIDNYSG